MYVRDECQHGPRSIRGHAAVDGDLGVDDLLRDNDIPVSAERAHHAEHLIVDVVVCAPLDALHQEDLDLVLLVLELQHRVAVLGLPRVVHDADESDVPLHLLRL